MECGIRRVLNPVAGNKAECDVERMQLGLKCEGGLAAYPR